MRTFYCPGAGPAVLVALPVTSAYALDFLVFVLGIAVPRRVVVIE